MPIQVSEEAKKGGQSEHLNKERRNDFIPQPSRFEEANTLNRDGFTKLRNKIWEIKRSIKN
jgi:hypothetical protein